MAMVQRDGSGEEALNNGDCKEEVAEEEEESKGATVAQDGAVVTTPPVMEEGDGNGSNSSSSSSSSSGESKASMSEEASAEVEAEDVAKEPGPPRHQYSKAELLKLRNGDHKRPTCLDPAYNNLSGMWDPERWFLGKRRGGSVSPADETAAAQSTASSTTVAPAPSGGSQQQRSKRERLDSESGTGEPIVGVAKRRSTTDPKERLAREERDDLVLSPQRRSFGTGCHVSQPPSRSSSEASIKDDQQGLLHSREPPSRRIGSGRILRDQRDWDRDNREYGYGGGRRFDDAGHSTSGGHSNRYGRSRGGRDERIEEEEEPEWFVGGPTSQHDTIELVGFEEDPEMSRRAARRMRRSREFASRKQQQQQQQQQQQNGTERRTADQEPRHDKEQQSAAAAATSQGSSTVTTSTATSIAPVVMDSSSASALRRNDSRESSNSANCAIDISKSSGDGPGQTSTPLTTSPTLPDSVGAAPPALPAQDGFDFNDIFKPDWCPRFLSEDALGDTEAGLSGGSRFSQWFRRDSPPLEQQSVPPLDSGLLAALSRPAAEESGHPPRQQHQENDLASRILASAGVTSGDGMLRVPTPDSYFTPISPALPHDRLSPSPPVRGGTSKNILDILMDANINVEAHMLNGDAAKTAQLREHALAGKAKSVEELEADLKQVVLGVGGHSRPIQHHHHHHHRHHEQPQHAHHPMGVVPTLNLPLQQQSDQQQQQQQQHLQGLLSKLGAHPGGPGASLVVPPSLPERALHEEDLLRVAGQMPPTPMQHHGMASRGGGDALQPPGLLSQLLRTSGKGPHQHQQQQPQGGQDMLVKILAGMGPVSPGLQPPPPPMASQQQLSPTAQLLAARHDPMAAAAAAAMLRQQQQQEMLNSLLKPPVVTTQRPSPTQQLGLLAPCPSPLTVPQDPRRVPSPLVFGQHPSPVPPVAGPTPGAPVPSSNTLQVHSGNLRPRVPSPQELAVHTQSILQTALLKKILEDQKQKENLRKQQEAQRTRSPTMVQGQATNRGSSPSKGLSPTMASFTPTSVMRKMHMERQDHPKEKGGPKANGEAPTDVASRQQHQQQHRVGNGTASRAPTIGRAIKGNQAGPPPPPPATTCDTKNLMQIQQQQQAAGSLMRGAGGDMDMMAKLLEQQQRLLQQQRAAAPPAVLSGLVRQQQGHPALKLPGMMRATSVGAAAAVPPPPAVAPARTHAGGPLKGMTGGNPRGASSVEMLQQALAQGLHPLAFQQFLLGGAPPPAVGGPAPPFAQPLHPSQGHPFAPGAGAPRDVKGSGMMPGGLPGRGPAVPAAPGVPPGNLAKWFGSDVLYQPTLPPVPHQKALLVEEVERQQQQATAVKN